MNVVYIVDYSIIGNSGKQKATREKAAALSQNTAINQFTFISDKPRNSLLSKIFGKAIFDILTAIKILRKQNFIVVQRVLFLPITRLVLAIKQIKVVSEYHADLKEEIPFLNKPSFHKKLLKFSAIFYNMNFRLSNGIIYNHPYLKSKYDPIYNKPSIFSYNGSNYSEYYPINMQEARSALGISSKGTIFLFLGSVSQWHGVDYLIDIFNESVIKANADLWLFVVGANENLYTTELQNKISNNQIKFLSPVETDVANLYINASNFCLLPVKQIRSSPGSPLKLYDYISCGKPVITQESLSGYSDEVNRYELGYTIDFTRKELAALKLNSILQNFTDNDCRFFKKNNRAVATNEVSWSRRIDNWIDFLSSISE